MFAKQSEHFKVLWRGLEGARNTAHIPAGHGERLIAGAGLVQAGRRLQTDTPQAAPPASGGIYTERWKRSNSFTQPRGHRAAADQLRNKGITMSIPDFIAAVSNGISSALPVPF